MRLTRDESQAIIDQTNQASMAVAMQVEVTIADHLEQLAASQPDAVFLIFEDQRISYSRVNAEAEKYTAIAVSQGLRRGDAVALMMENRPEFFYLWFGMLKAGLCTALINTEARGKALSHAVTTVGCKLAFVGTECLQQYLGDDQLVATLPTVQVPEANATAEPAAGILTLPEALAQAAATSVDRSLRAGLTNAATAAYIFTSGTTGLPKAAYITHGKWLSTGQRWLVMTDLHKDDVFYCVLPIFHGAGLMSLFSTVLAVGGRCVLRRKFSASNFWSDIQQYQVTCFIYVGEICRYLVSTAATQFEHNHSVRVMLGAGMGVDVWQQFTARFGDHIRIYEGWGSTEANCNLSNVENVPGSCGRIPHWDKTFMRMVQYSVEEDAHPRDENGFLQLAGPGEPGELLGQVCTGDGTLVSPFDGYSDAAATRKKMLENVFEAGDKWFRSGDLFRYDENGYFYFVDRVGDTFRWKAENVSTTEVVQQLAGYSDAELINVFGVKVPATEGRAGMAAIGMVAGKQFDGARFYQVATENLPAYAVPLFVRLCVHMDLTGTFKLRKVDLQAEGYDPALYADELYLLDHGRRCYSPYTLAGLEALGVAPFERDQYG